MLEVKDLSFAYGKRETVLDRLSLTLGDGEVGILLGKNGSGKTTLFKNILGLLTPQSGSVLFDGRDLHRLSRAERAETVAYVPQAIELGGLSVFDTVLLGRLSRFGTVAGNADRAAAEKALCDMKLEDYADRSVSCLSGGERQKVAIARALAQEAKLLIFDEPTGNLDITGEQLIVGEARRLAHEKGITVLSSLHDLNRALDFGDRFFFLSGGRVVFDCKKDGVTAGIINKTFGSRVRIIEHDGEKIILGEKIP